MDIVKGELNNTSHVVIGVETVSTQPLLQFKLVVSFKNMVYRTLFLPFSLGTTFLSRGGLTSLFSGATHCKVCTNKPGCACKLVAAAGGVLMGPYIQLLVR